MSLGFPLELDNLIIKFIEKDNRQKKGEEEK